MNNHTKYDTAKVGKGYRKFNGEFYQFQYKASMVGSFADNGYQKHIQEVEQKKETLKSQGYKVMVVENGKGEYLFYLAGERMQ